MSPIHFFPQEGKGQPLYTIGGGVRSKELFFKRLGPDSKKTAANCMGFFTNFDYYTLHCNWAMRIIMWVFLSRYTKQSLTRVHVAL